MVFLFSCFLNIWQTLKHHFLIMFEANASKYFQGACHHFRVPATEVPETLQPVLSMELFAISSMSEVRSEPKDCLGASLRLTMGFRAKKTLRKYD